MPAWGVFFTYPALPSPPFPLRVTSGERIGPHFYIDTGQGAEADMDNQTQACGRA